MQQGSPFGAGPFRPFDGNPGFPHPPRRAAGSRPPRKRHGNDQLNIMLLILALVLAFVSFATCWVVLYASVALVGVAGVRAFSKDDAARRRENERFMSAFGRRRPSDATASPKASREKDSTAPEGAASGHGADRNAPEAGKAAGDADDAVGQPTPVVLACPSCGQRLSVPSGKGKVRVRCPKCGAVSDHTT